MQQVCRSRPRWSLGFLVLGLVGCSTGGGPADEPADLGGLVDAGRDVTRDLAGPGDGGRVDLAGAGGDPDLAAPADQGASADLAPPDAGPGRLDGGDLSTTADARPFPLDLEPAADQGAALDADLPPDAADGGAPPRDGGPEEECQIGQAGCTCVLLPRHPETSCTHSFGGLYGDGACSGAYQCCAGRWRAGLDQCAPCTCREPTGELGCLGPDEEEQSCFPTFAAQVSPLSAELRDQLTGSSWHAGCPVGLDELRLLELPHWGFDGELHAGRLVVAAAVAEDIVTAFAAIYERRFPIERMRLVDEYGADDDRSMADNNTSAFNCRTITGGGSWSRHSYGTAIDVNPVQNPYVRGETILPPAGSEYVDRSLRRPGMILDPGPVVRAFRGIGWGWGGDWDSFKDYQHFSSDGW